jgi:hypothetical protein
MATNGQILSSQDIFTNPSGGQIQSKWPRDVGQDKDAPLGVRFASVAPVSVEDPARPYQEDTTNPHAKPRSKRRRLQQVASWVDGSMKEQLQAMARSEGLSVSQTIYALLKEILRQRFHKQQAALLPEIIKQAVAEAHRTWATRFAFLLVRIAFDSGQNRVLSTNLLGRQEGMTEETLKEILQTADKRTKANLTRKTPQLTELVHTVEEWLMTEERVKPRKEDGR